MKSIFFYAFFLLTLLLSIGVNAQKKKKKAKAKVETDVSDLIKQADKLFEQENNYLDASKLYSEAADREKDNLYANYRAGEMHLRVDSKPRALRYLTRVYNKDKKYRADLVYLLADAYRQNYKFSRAIEYFVQYLEMLNMSQLEGLKGEIISPARVNKSIEECKYAQINLRKPQPYNIKNMGTAINSPFPEYSPNMNLDETVLVFTTRREKGNQSKKYAVDGLPFEDIFISEKNPDTGVWGQAHSMGPRVNTPQHDSNISISSSSNLLYLYSDTNGGDIYSTKLKDNSKLRSVRHLPSPVNTNYKEHSFVEAPDGSYAILSSDRPGGIGGLDLYIVEKEGNEWAKVRNIGVEINTPFDEISPFIHPNGRMLFFASQGHKNMGGFDIFRSTYDEEAQKWTVPHNMGYPINTPDNDVYFIVSLDGKTAYLSSVKTIGLGFSDIYQLTVGNEYKDKTKIFTSAKASDVPEKKPVKKISAEKGKDVAAVPKPPSPATKKGKVTKTISDIPSDMNIPESAKIIIRLALIDAETGETLPGKNVQMRNIETGGLEDTEFDENDNANFFFNNKEKKEYILTAQYDGYAFRSFIVTVPKASTKRRLITQKVPLKKIRDGDKQVLRNIYFKFNSAELLELSYGELNKLSLMVKENPEMSLKIIGHTDVKGSALYNIKLSKKRAKAVEKYLLGQGISKSRLITIGKGNTDPLASNDDEEDGRELNRRVEFQIVLRK